MLIAQNLSKHYPSAQGWIKSLDEMDLEVKAGEFLAIRGHSGSGKTTLLLTLGAMLRPSSGRVVFEGQDMYQCSSQQRAAWRAEQIGFVFQMFHLMPYLSVLDNLCLHGRAKAGSTQRADTLLDTLNLKHRVNHLPHQLSAGDEPTGNLDPRHATEVCEHLRKFRDSGGTVILVTHGELASSFADRTIFLEQGRLLETVEGHAQTAP
jgi:ABC-type lipoprotein export system ATPase subunit